jgi:Papain-like cysteine protease AvrRpt2
LTITGNLASTTNASVPFATVKGEIDNSRPISIGIYWYGGGGHNPAIDGYDDSDPSAPTIDIQDPWYGQSTQDFNSFPSTYNGGANWGTTYLTQ